MKKGLLSLVLVVTSVMLVVSMGGCGTFQIEPIQEEIGPIQEVGPTQPQPSQEIEQMQAKVPMVLGFPFEYKLTEHGRQLLEKTGLRNEMQGMITMHRFLSPYEELMKDPVLVNDYILLLGAQRLVSIARENEVSVDILIAVLHTGFQEIYVEIYGID